MKKIQINPTVILRIPAFSISDKISDVWKELKIAIAASSPEFYARIAQVIPEEIDHLDFKTRYTIWKYFNRSKYRGTPYGYFAGIAVASLSADQDEQIISRKQKIHKFEDWSLADTAVPEMTDLHLKKRRYFANTTAYISGNAIRFIAFHDGAFELAEIDNSMFIKELLELCSVQVQYLDIANLASRSLIEEEVIIGILRALLELQLLFTDLDKNIIGNDYFVRNTGLLNVPENSGYLIAERKVLSGNLSVQRLRHLSACIDHLSNISDTIESNDLNEFRDMFVQRFEGLEIPLMTALDPEAGIGYGGLEGLQIPDIIDYLSDQRNKASKINPQITPFSSWILKQMFCISKDSNGVIRLENYQIENSRSAVLPNTFSALVKFAGDLLIIDHLGGCNSNALAGRFSIANEEVARHCKIMADAEAAANPDVIFFDVAYVAEGKVDNINRRCSFYKHELTILNYSCCEDPIPLNDLIVTVKHGQIILMSLKYKKRVIPRMASAYNYSRSDLSVYKFLCDLQHQGLKSKLLFDILQMFPELDYYPRIQYENIILSPAKWRIYENTQGKTFERYLTELNLCRYISVGKGDQTLIFDLKERQDQIFLQHYLSIEKEVLAEEVIFDDHQQLKDEYRKSYHGQILLSISHPDKVYDNHAPKQGQLRFSQKIMPGMDWLYLEIYCHEAQVNRILHESISTFIKKYRAEIKNWFFIRYTEPSSHIRLRIQMKSPARGYLYVRKLISLLGSDIHSGKINDVQIKTYSPEYGRYGFHQMEMTTTHFMADSDYAISRLIPSLGTSNDYKSSIYLMQFVLEKVFDDRNEALSFVKQVLAAFEAEHQLATQDFKKINAEWKRFRQEFYHQPIIEDPDILCLVNSFHNVISQAPEYNRNVITSDLFHMHINRLFISQQRTHELIIYSFLYKHLLENKKRPNPELILC